MAINNIISGDTCARKADMYAFRECRCSGEIFTSKDNSIIELMSLFGQLTVFAIVRSLADSLLSVSVIIT